MLVFTAMDRRHALRERIGRRLRMLRTEKGFRAPEVIARLACSESHYYKIERGEIEVTSAMLSKLARVFHTDEVDLLIFPDEDPLRHGVYEILRLAPEPVLLRAKAFVLDEIARLPVPATIVAAEPADIAPATTKPAPARKKKGAAR